MGQPHSESKQLPAWYLELGSKEREEKLVNFSFFPSGPSNYYCIYSTIAVDTITLEKIVHSRIKMFTDHHHCLTFDEKMSS